MSSRDQNTGDPERVGQAATAPEKRREPRRPGRGSVEVKWTEPVATTVRGSLVDVSNSGFRMAHSCATLETGTIVEFAHEESQGRARVVWTRVIARDLKHTSAGHQVETGFVIVE
jgi:hypothetical protein